MQLTRRLGPPMAAMLFIALSVLTVSLGEGFRWLGPRKVADGLLKRDGSNLTFSLLWGSPAVAADTSLLPVSNVKLTDPLGELLNDITNVAGNLLSDGTNLAGSIVNDASGLLPNTAAGISGDWNGGVSSILNDVNSDVNQGNQILSLVVSDAASFVGGILGAITSTLLNANEPAAATLPTSQVPPQAGSIASVFGNSVPLSISPTSALIVVLPSNLHSTSNTASPGSRQSGPGASATLSITSTTLLASVNSPAAFPVASPGSVIPTYIRACPMQLLSTVTVTETWHRTCYAVTATLYSFMSVLTVPCNQATSPCPASNLNPNMSNASSSFVMCPNDAVVQDQNECQAPPTVNTLPPATSPSPVYPCLDTGFACSECPGGYFCPPVQTPAQRCPCGLGWAYAHCNSGWYCSPAPTGAPGSPASGAYFMPTNAGYLALSNSLPGHLLSASPTPGSHALPMANPLPTVTATCPDRSSALSLENCTNGALSPLSLSPPSLSSLPAGGEAGTGGNGPSKAIDGISFTIGNLQDITGSLQSVYISRSSSIPIGLNTGGLVPGCITAKPVSTGLISSPSIVTIVPIPTTGSVSVLPVINGATDQSIPVFSLSVTSNENEAAGNILSSLLSVITSTLQAGQIIPGAVDNHMSSVLPVVTDVPVAVQTGIGGAVNGIGGLLSPIQSAVNSAAQNFNGAAGSPLNPVQSAVSGAVQNVNGAAGTLLGTVNGAVQGGQDANGGAAIVPVVKNIISSGDFGGGLGLKSRRRNSKREVPVEIVTVKDVSFCQQNPSLESCFWVFD